MEKEKEKEQREQRNGDKEIFAEVIEFVKTESKDVLRILFENVKKIINVPQEKIDLMDIKERERYLDLSIQAATFLGKLKSSYGFKGMALVNGSYYTPKERPKKYNKEIEHNGSAVDKAMAL